ncbi:MAG: aminodeoxychorismate lyase [Gammaproteobacteria bacterium]
MLVNGRESNLIPIADRGFQYGDGLFETLAVENGQPLLLARHLERLRNGCERLAIRFPGNDLLSREAIGISKGAESAILKILVTRGSGGRGYQVKGEVHPTRVLSIHPRPEFPADYQTSGIRMILCRNRLGINPSLAGLKHMNRLEQILARAEWDDPQIQEGLMLDSEGNVIEGTMTNLFLVRSALLTTPDLSGCGVAGIMRSQVLEVARTEGLAAQIKKVAVDDLLEADEVFVTNSVIGLWPVIEFEHVPYEIGPVTSKILQGLKRVRALAGPK